MKCDQCKTVFITVAGESTTEEDVYGRWEWAWKEFGDCKQIYEYPTASPNTHKWYYCRFGDADSDVDEELDHPERYQYASPWPDQDFVFRRKDSGDSVRPSKSALDLIIDEGEKEELGLQLLEEIERERNEKLDKVPEKPLNTKSSLLLKKSGVPGGTNKAGKRKQRKKEPAAEKAQKATNSSPKKRKRTAREVFTDTNVDETKTAPAFEEEVVISEPLSQPKLKRRKMVKTAW